MRSFVHNMLAGAGGIDFVLLVVAADDGVMPQTREHLAIVDLLGVARGLVAMTKVDLVTPERREAVTAEIAQTLDGTGLPGAISCRFRSSPEKVSRRCAGDCSTRRTTVGHGAANGRFRLAVDRSFTLSGAGTVVTGTVLSGAVTIGDHVVVSPSGLSARVRSIHAQNRRRSADGPASGARSISPVTVSPKITSTAATWSSIPNCTPRATGSMRVYAYCLRAQADHAVDAGSLAPCGSRSRRESGPSGDGRLRRATRRLCSSCLNGRSPPPQATASSCAIPRRSARSAAAGFSICVLPRGSGGRPSAWHSSMPTRSTDPDRALAALLECAPGYVDLTDFARDRALGVDEVERIAETLALVRIPIQRTVVVLSPERWGELQRRNSRQTCGFSRRKPRFTRHWTRTSSVTARAAIAGTGLRRGLAGNGAAPTIGARRRMGPTAGHEVRLTAADETLWRAVEPLLAGEQRFRPPRVRDIGATIGVGEAHVRRLFKLLGRLGKVDEIAHDHFFLRDTVAEMVEIAADLAAQAPNGQFTAAEFRDRLDNGRKVAIQILEFFDRHGVTLRRGDLRRMNKYRLDLFRRPPMSSGRSSNSGRDLSPVGRPDFKSGGGREPVFGGFDSHSLPPNIAERQMTAMLRFHCHVNASC